MPAADPAAGDQDRRARRRLTVPHWTDLARSLGLLGLGAAAIIVAVANLVDERGEGDTVHALAVAADRQAFEQECRFDLAQPVAELEAEQIDVLVDLAIARGAGDTAALQAGLDRLADIRERKRTAVDERAGAVAECQRRAAALFGPGA